MTTSPPGDAARVTVLVRVKPQDAFEVFTQETDLWWRRGVAYRVAGSRVGTLAFIAPDADGRGGTLRQTFTGDDGDVRTHDAGNVLVWQPPTAREDGSVVGRLLFTWRAINFAADESTEVEVLFEESASGTRVTLEHRGFARLRADHPVRHGLEVAAFVAMMGRWWGGLLTSMREHAVRP